MTQQTASLSIKAGVVTLLVALLLPSFLIESSSASEAVSLTTGDLDLTSGIKVRLTCSLNVELYPASYTVESGKSVTFYTYPWNGTVTLGVFIPSPISSWYSMSANLTSLSYVTIPITTGLDATLSLEPSASLSVSGPGSLTESSFSWSSMAYTKQFNLISQSNAPGGAVITVNEDFSLQAYISLNINFVLFRQQIGRMSIGQFPMLPRISRNITVSVPNLLIALFNNPAFLIVFFLVLLVAAMYITYRRNVARERRRRMQARVPALRQVETTATKPADQPTPTETYRRPQEKISEAEKAVYCIHCGEQLPLHALYCRKCGKKVE